MTVLLSLLTKLVVGTIAAFILASVIHAMIGVLSGLAWAFQFVGDTMASALGHIDER